MLIFRINPIKYHHSRTVKLQDEWAAATTKLDNKVTQNLYKHSWWGDQTPNYMTYYCSRVCATQTRLCDISYHVWH